MQEGQGDKMTTDWVKEPSKQEAYAREHGYTVIDSDYGFHYVYRQGAPLPLAECLSHSDAVRVAYDLAAEVFQTAEV
jgi:hypothetical protein